MLYLDTMDKRQSYGKKIYYKLLFCLLYFIHLHLYFIYYLLFTVDIL